MSFLSWLTGITSHKSRGRIGGPIVDPTEPRARREHLFNVVREVMLKAGVLATSYTFKVLSLDPRSAQYVIMMEFAWLHDGDSDRLTTIEQAVTRQAKYQYDIAVTAMYWRAKEFLAERPRPAKPVYEPVRSAELPRRLSSPGEIVPTHKRKAQEPSGFEDTRFEHLPSPLSGTQYGRL